MNFDRVLAVIDERPESMELLDHLSRISARASATLTVLDVVEDSCDTELDAGEVRDEVLASMRGWLEARILPWTEAPTRVSVRWGIPSVEVIREGISQNAGLVGIVARPAGPVTSPFDSTSLHLIRKFPGAAWVHVPGCRVDGAVIVACVAPGQGPGDPRFRTALQVALGAERLAREIGGCLHLAHAWHPVALPRLVREGASAAQMDRYRLAVKNHAREALEALVEALPSTPQGAHLLEGPPSSVLPPLFDRVEASVVALGSVGTHLADGLLMGEVAEELLRRTRCSVCCFKPANFATPVRTLPTPGTAMAAEERTTA